MSVNIIVGDARKELVKLPASTVRCCVTSPPYFGLRDYGVEGQIGLESNVDEYIARLMEVFDGVRRVLSKDGTLWLNLGDSYSGSGRGTDDGMKQKELIGIPWRVAFALQARGWYLRQDIIWHKPNPMPESVRDRCTKAHEYLFLFSKSPRYYFDSEAISEPVTQSTIERVSQLTYDKQAGSSRVPGKTNGPMKAVVKRSGNLSRKSATERDCPADGVAGNVPWEGTTRNKRSVWTVATKSFKGAHFATFPPELIEPCVLAGSAPGDTVLDPFGGAGTTGLVADRHQRDAVLIEINSGYAEIARNRIEVDSPLFTTTVLRERGEEA